MLRATAEEAMTQTGFVFDEATGMYYDRGTSFYYDSVRHAESSLPPTDVAYELAHRVFPPRRPVSCTTTPTRAFTTASTPRAGDTNSTPGSRWPPRSRFKTRAPRKRKAGS